MIFISLTTYESTNRVRINLNNVIFYKTIKVGSVPSQTTNGYRDIYKTGIYFQNDPVPLVVEEDVIVVDKLITEALSSNS